jgi:hypothetical protein
MVLESFPLNRMGDAYVAFDLDNTLGFFELTNPLAYLWSPEYLSNPEQSAPNAPLEVSARLLAKLRRARDYFAMTLAGKEELLWIVLRPNLWAIMDPLVRAKRAGNLGAVVIYSNTGVSYSVELGKDLIERVWRVPGLIRVTADHWSPLRTADRVDPPSANAEDYVEPLKTIDTLQTLFRKATRGNSSVRRSRKAHAPIPLQRILFVDDRSQKHALSAQEEGGLTYLVPTRYVPAAADVPVVARQHLFAMALEAMDRAGLLRDKEYLESGFCHRDIPHSVTKLERIRGFADLFTWVWEEMQSVRLPRKGWEDDGAALAAAAKRFFRQ